MAVYLISINLIKQCTRLKSKVSVIKFVNDINILIYEKSTENNYRILNKLYNMCKK